MQPNKKNESTGDRTGQGTNFRQQENNRTRSQAPSPEEGRAHHAGLGRAAPPPAGRGGPPQYPGMMDLGPSQRGPRLPPMLPAPGAPPPMRRPRGLPAPVEPPTLYSFGQEGNERQPPPAYQHPPGSRERVAAAVAAPPPQAQPIYPRPDPRRPMMQQPAQAPLVPQGSGLYRDQAGPPPPPVPNPLFDPRVLLQQQYQGLVEREVQLREWAGRLQTQDQDNNLRSNTLALEQELVRLQRRAVDLDRQNLAGERQIWEFERENNEQGDLAATRDAGTQTEEHEGQNEGEDDMDVDQVDGT